MLRSLLVSALLPLLLPISIAFAEDAATQKPLTIGYIGSLTSFAASYGTAALKGIELALEDERASGAHISLVTEDDQSETKNTVTAYTKLKSLNHVDGLLTGTWWANAIVKNVERDKIPFLSVETLFDSASLSAPNYFLMQGDLHAWVRTFEPLIQQKGWTTGATVRFASGFGMTLAETMEEEFSKPGRQYAGTIEYSDVQGGDIAGIGLKLKKLNPQVVYIDANPNSLGSFISKFRELGMTGLVVLSNQIVEDAIAQKLLSVKTAQPIYYTKRQSIDGAFAQRFKMRFGDAPMLNADLAFTATKLLVGGLKRADPVASIKATGQFDERNLYNGLQYDVWSYDEHNVPAPMLVGNVSK